MEKLYVRNIKKGFATNSSSYHSTLILTAEEYEKWKNGEILFDDISFSSFDSDEYDEETGFYYYIESQSERTLDNGQKVIAITYCETNEY